MKNSKRIMAFGLSAALALSLAACGGDDSNDGGSGGDSTAELTEFVDWQTQANEMTTWMPLYSEESWNGRVLQNCFDYLLTRDNHQNVIPQLATEYSHSDDVMTWTFKLRDNATWVNQQCEVMADLTAQDFLTGMEWILNYWKNDAKNVSMLVEMIDGAQDYYDYTKTLTQDEAYALTASNEKFQSMVGIKAPDDYTLEYHLTKAAPYFHTVIMGVCGNPLSQAQVDAMGVEAVKAQTPETMWYSGPYVVSEYYAGNSKTLVPNTNYWNKDAKIFDSVTIKMVEDAIADDQLFMNGEIDRCDVNISNLRTIWENEDNQFHDNLVMTRTTSAHYTFMYNFNKKNDDGSLDTNWNTAIANENFRQAIRWGLDREPLWEAANFISPEDCKVETFSTPDLVKFSNGVDYVDRVAEIAGTTDGHYDTDKATEYMNKAKEELTAQGVTFPVTMTYYIKAGDQTAKDTADVLAQQMKNIGEDFINFEIKTYITNQTQEVTNPGLHSMVMNGWIADYTDPENFLNQIVLGNDNAYYTNRILYTNDMAEGETKDQWQTFTNMANAANDIVADMDERYEAQAQAEAYALDHALIVPIRNTSTWSMTKADTYATPRASYRYQNWHTQQTPFTSEQYAELKAAFDAEVNG